jgi:hypothetical protein
MLKVLIALYFLICNSLIRWIFPAFSLTQLVWRVTDTGPRDIEWQSCE